MERKPQPSQMIIDDPKAPAEDFKNLEKKEPTIEEKRKEIVVEFDKQAAEINKQIDRIKHNLRSTYAHKEQLEIARKKKLRELLQEG